MNFEVRVIAWWRDSPFPWFKGEGHAEPQKQFYWWAFNAFGVLETYDDGLL
jgi:hypothetical protein